MKKMLYLFLCFALVFVTLILPACALAEDGPSPAPTTAPLLTDDPAAPSEPFSWAYLASIAGATAATVLIVQFLKVPLDKIWKIPTRAFVYVIALILLLVGTAFTSGLTLDTALLTVVNAFIVALTAYGTYEVTFRKLNK